MTMRVTPSEGRDDDRTGTLPDGGGCALCDRDFWHLPQSEECHRDPDVSRIDFAIGEYQPCRVFLLFGGFDGAGLYHVRPDSRRGRGRDWSCDPCLFLPQPWHHRG